MPVLPSAVLFALWGTCLVGFWGGVGYLALRFVRAHERRGLHGAQAEALEARVQLLEDTVERLTSELCQVREGQDFAAALGAGRPDRSA